MVLQGLRLAAFFAGYTAVGATGDWVVEEWALSGAEPAAYVVELEPSTQMAPARTSDMGRRGDRCDYYEVERRATMAASASSRLRVAAGSGELQVEGRADLDQVRVVGSVCASEEAYLETLQVTVERRGDEIEVRAHYPDSRDRTRRSGRDVARIDLVIEVPLNMAADLDDSSGSMYVRGLGDVRIDDSSGSITVEGLNGSLTIDDSSGEIEVRDVSGNVTIDDGSGDIDVADVGGSVRLQDGSGSIRAVEVDRDVIVERDGSGSIDVRDVAGDFTVQRDGSGSVRHSGVQGRVDIPPKKGRRGRGN